VRSAFLIVFGFWLCLAAGPAVAEKRVALVVGVSAYQQVPRLPNPIRDSEVMTDLFKKAGFDTVESRRDLGIGELRRAIREFSETARDADIAVVYYAGHGIEVDGTNYLVPADAKLVSDFDIEDETISLDRVLKALDLAKRLKLVILDACRDNPFARTMKRTVASRAIGRGLAKIEPTMSDTLVAYAAKAGAVANDGDGQNSPFAVALTKHITEPGLDLRIAFGRVRDDVLKATGNRQEPFVYGSLGGDTMTLVPRAAKPADADAEARIDYELAAQVGTKDAWNSFLAKHPTGFFADLARAQNAKLSAAQDTSARANDAKRQAEEQAAQKAAEFRKQLEEQAARQAADARQKLSDQTRRELEEARQQIAEQAKKQLDDARRQLELAQKQADAARAQVEEAKREAATDAQVQVEQSRRDEQETKKLAALTPDQPPVPAAPASPQMDSADVARLLQAHLKRVGCNPGNTEGKWDDGSRKALELFNKNAKTKFDIKLASLDALDAVRAKPDRVCPLVCDAGYVLNSSGSCEKKPEAASKPRTVTRQERAAPSRRGGGGGRCFAFNGKTYCE
jgi:uncharacterized caspase-like protein